MSKEESPSLSPHQRQINNAISFCEDHHWDILAQALKYCWGNGFLDTFRKYFRDHAHLFVGMTHGMNQNEHTLEQHACFTDYLQLYEDQLADYVENHPEGPRASVRDFYQELQEAKDTGHEDPGTAEFIHCLIASADYDSFYSVMVREARKLQAREAMEATAKLSGELPEMAEAKPAAASVRSPAKELDEDGEDAKAGDAKDAK